MSEITALRSRFPIFQAPEHTDLVYFDSGATAQKPAEVIDAIREYYVHSTANVHRGVYDLADKSTALWEESRMTIAQFVGAGVDELVLTRNTTEAINGVAYGWGERAVGSDDTIMVSGMEHHANLVPWQELVHRKQAHLEILPVDMAGQVDLPDLEVLLQNKTVKLVAITHVSNVLGSVVDVQAIAQLIKRVNRDRGTKTRLLVDGAQAVPHLGIDVKKLGADFYVFSGHKMYGPMGIGALIIRQELLDSGEMAPWLYGGGMIEQVQSHSATYSDNLSDRFTAGTPDVASAVGLASACRFLTGLGMSTVADHTQELVRRAWQIISERDEVQLIGPDPNMYDRTASVAFVHRSVHAHDVAQVFNSEHVAVRSGHHCAMPLHTQFNWSATTRLSFGVYNEITELEKIPIVLEKIKKLFI